MSPISFQPLCVHGPGVQPLCGLHSPGPPMLAHLRTSIASDLRFCKPAYLLRPRAVRSKNSPHCMARKESRPTPAYQLDMKTSTRHTDSMDNTKPSSRLQEAILSALENTPKTATELEYEGCGSKRSVQGALSYLHDMGRVYKHHVGDYGRVYYMAVAGVSRQAGDGGSVTTLKFKVQGHDLTARELYTSLARSQNLPVAKRIASLIWKRAGKSAARAKGNEQVFRKHSMESLREELEGIRASCLTALDILDKLERTPILWAADDGYLYRVLGWSEDEAETLMIFIDEGTGPE